MHWFIKKNSEKKRALSSATFQLTRSITLFIIAFNIIIFASVAYHAHDQLEEKIHNKSDRILLIIEAMHEENMGLNKGDVIGLFSARYDATNDYIILNSYLLKIGLMLIVLTALIAVSIFLLIRHVIGRPIGNIAHTMTQIAAGQSNVTIPPFGDNHELDEIISAAHVYKNLAIDKNRELAPQKHALDEHAIVSITDHKGIIIYANDKFCQISQYSREELIGQNHRVLKSNEHPKKFFADMWRTLVRGETWHGEIKNKNKSGLAYWVKTSIVPEMGPDGKPYQYIAIRTDITDNKQQANDLLQARLELEIRLEEKIDSQHHLEKLSSEHVQLADNLMIARDEANSANDMKTRFLAAMSHEIRTPMTGVIGMVDLLLNSKMSTQQQSWARMIKTSGEHQLVILNKILDMSKLEANKLEISTIKIDLESLIHETIQIFEQSAIDKGLELRINLDDTLPKYIKADSLRISQILSNLISNALKFTDSGSITVHLEPYSDKKNNLQIKYSVIDTGIGLNKEEQGEIFTAFTQADKTISRVYGGTGLGLSISKSLIELMSGEIGVDSTKGEGSRFWFTVPYVAVKNDGSPLDEQIIHTHWTSLRQLRILVAEDNLINQELISMIFEGLDQTVLIAENGKIALEKIKDSSFDLILMDIRMPIMNGIEATESIRSMDSHKCHIPIIALTADITDNIAREYLSSGIDAVCSKPIILNDLLSTINNIMGERIFIPANDQAPLLYDQLPAEQQEDIAIDISLDKILETISTMADQPTNQDQEEVSPPEISAGLGKKYSELLKKYEKILLEKCQNLESLIDDLSNNFQDNEVREQAKNLTHDVKGGGSMFGYDLIASIARKADDILHHDTKLDEDSFRTLKFLADAMLLVATKKMSGNGGKAGQVLLQRVGTL